MAVKEKKVEASYLRKGVSLASFHLLLALISETPCQQMKREKVRKGTEKEREPRVGKEADEREWSKLEYMSKQGRERE